ncbi:MAG: protein sphX, partial [Pseudobdellovibrionaceae bacterium]
IYVSEKSYQRPEVKEFIEYYMKNAIPLVKSVNYVPLPAKAYEIALDHLKKNKLGTVFGGKTEIGMKIEELMKKETVQ